MKIRTSYVSNSSSSSFLIICKNFSEFDKFKVFDGYETFKEDFDKSSEEEAINWLASEFYLYIMAWDVTHKGNSSMAEIYADVLSSSKLISLLYSTELPAEAREIFIHTTNELSLMHCKNSDTSEYISNLDCRAFGKAFLEAFKSAGYTLKALEYCDHDETEAYMEHNFMPFLQLNPESKLQQVYCRNEH